MGLRPDTLREVAKLADELRDLFTPPDYIPGCEVKSVADKDVYASDNGWIEAVVGQHNQQRCRWRGQFAGVAVGDFVDVLFFASYGLFVVFGQGGTGGVSDNILNNYAGTTAPTANDDAGDGYAVGSHWVDVTNDDAYVCLDATATAAVWLAVTVGATDHGGLAGLGDDDHTQYLLASGTRTGASSQAQVFTNGVDLNGLADGLILDADGDTTISAPTDDQIDFEVGGVDRMTLTDAGLALTNGRVIEVSHLDDPLVDSADASGITSHFRDNDSSYPAGWTESDAAVVSNTDSVYSYWYLAGTSVDTSWKYRIKSDVDLENDVAASAYASFTFGPIFWRDFPYSADLHYRLGLCRNNAGSIDEATYVRVDFYWNSSSGVWQIRGEEQDGTTPHTSSYVTLTQPLHQPLYFRVNVQNAAAKAVYVYWATQRNRIFHSLLFGQYPSAAPTWGDLWVQFELSRGAGSSDQFYVGSLDYDGNAP